MGSERVAFRLLVGVGAVVALSALACAWLARSDWLYGVILRMEPAAFLRIGDVLGFGALGLLLAFLIALHRRASRVRRDLNGCRRLLENVAEGVVVVDARRRIVSVNGPMGRLFGYEPADLIGRALEIVLPKGLPESGTECVGRRKDGSDIHLEVKISSPPLGVSRETQATLILRDITPSKKAHETLNTRETYLRMVVEQMPAILWTTDIGLQITSTVGAGLAAVNLKARDAIGMSMLECLERDNVECTPISAHMKALRGESLSYEMEWKGRTFQVRVDPLRNGEKDITGTIGILVDVTEHKQAVAELKARHRQQAAVATLGQHALEGACLDGLLNEAVTLIGQTLDVECCAVLEASADGRTVVPRAVIGGRRSTGGDRLAANSIVEQQALRALRSTEPVILFGARQAATGGRQSIADTGLISGISTIVPGERRPFGVLTAHSVRARKFTHDDSHFIQAIAHILATAIERKQAEEAQARLVAILEATTDIVAVTGTNRRLLYLNRAGRILLGFGLQEDVSARSLTDCCPPAARSRLDESIARAVCDGAWSGEMTLASRDGVEIPVSQVMLAHKSPTGAFEFLSTIARDATERQRLEEQLRQAQKMEAIGRLAGGIAHDFNNLLCVITGYSTLATDGLPLDEPLRDFVGEITKAAERATALTQQLLAFSRKQMLVPRVLNLNALLTDLDNMLRRLIGEDIEMIVALAADLQAVKADQSQIEQILMNLVVNARDAMPSGGRLTIATTNIDLDATDLRDKVGQAFQPDSPASQAFQPDSPASQAFQPDSPASQAGKPDSPASQAGKPDSPASQAGKPDSPASQAGKPDSPASQAGKPDSPASQAGKPDLPYVCLAVSDTGCGMDKEVLTHLFEPFFTTKSQGKGTGLGLATVFGIVKQSNGHIQVHSEPNQGTTIRIYLPSFQAVGAIPPSPPSGREGRGEAARGVETLLLVEDEDGLRALASHALRRRGYHILEAANGEEALEVSRRYGKTIHLLLSDVVMPKLGGNALAERLVRERPDIKVLFMSGFTDSALFRHGVVCGEVECLLKPFTPSALTEKVREILDRPSASLVGAEPLPLQ